MRQLRLTFEWDELKAVQNLRKHGISFEEARTVFGDALALVKVDVRYDYDEERLMIIGESVRERFLTVVYVERTAWTMRLISARRASPRERREYEEERNR